MTSSMLIRVEEEEKDPGKRKGRVGGEDWDWVRTGGIKKEDNSYRVTEKQRYQFCI